MFIDSFESAIDKNPELPLLTNSITFLVWLKAQQQGLMNYEAAKEILKQRYGRPRQVIAAHMDQELKIPLCVGENHPSFVMFMIRSAFMCEDLKVQE